MPESADRSVSRDVEDSDNESLAGSTAPGKPGRKKNPNSQAARRDQNRIAQREFRLRKQQRIRDLEARVEILSGGKDEVLGEMRNILKDLMTENQTLRGLLRSLSGFIGEGAGGLLPKLGWEMSDFNNFINRTETDTAWEGYQRRKKTSAETGQSSSGAQKRPAEDDLNAHSKKARGEDSIPSPYMMMSMNQSPMNPGSVFPASRPSPQGGDLFSDMMRHNNESSLLMQPTSANANTPPQYNGGPGSNVYQPYVPNVHMNIDSSLTSMPFTPPSTTSAAMTPVTQPKQPTHISNETIEDEDDPNKNEAYKLIHYHLDNYKRNSAYCLPSSLRPTLVQRTVPHESVIDRILHPELRDRMILLRGRFDLVDCLLEYRNAVTIHGDDVLAHSNWEINEKWLRQYGFLVEQATLNIMNRWRRERGEPDLRLADIASSENTPGST
ncbi:hypothetical protein EDD18DRAFT_90352 [Armillaria luteobubalina]|uniref:BZIP domain-containing protein n=1 Tax=Armillaria luteobubalina TaxID=153913 RepID=A0AA39Q9Y4_9AGAR|nr:hypothetical protein EDD18DRAFT_90352 [Armillaria luteobubalina]